jgi:hypothetical protein
MGSALRSAMEVEVEVEVWAAACRRSAAIRLLAA